MSLENKSYTADDITILQGLEGIRKRPAMYIGSTNAFGLHHLVWEMIDNAVDEVMNGFGDTIIVTIHKDGSVSVSDNGRGIPVDMIPAYKKPAVEILFTTLHSGGKFSDKVYNASSGLHGVGTCVVNALSDFCDVTIYKNGTINHIRFEDGGKKVAVPLEVLGTTKKTGTTVRFKPDATVFTTVEFKWDTIYNHMQGRAFLTKGHFLLKDERSGLEQEFYYEDGIKQYVETCNQNKRPMSDIIYFQETEGKIEMSVAMQYCYEDYAETLFSYANSIRTKDGGSHETGFRLGLTRAVNDFAEANKLLKGKTNLDGNDIREGLTAVISLKLPEALNEFEGQTKSKLGSPEALNAVNNFIYKNFSYYLAENKDFALTLIKKCYDSQAARLAARKAREETRTHKKAKSEMIVSDKLTPAQSKDYKNCELFIVEGESAGGSARKARDRIYQAILPLRGKPLNTDGVTMDRMLKNEEFSTIIATIGSGVGQGFNVEDAHYGKIIIMTDADTDGAHIQTLLLTFFYRYMRPLIDAGMVYVAVPPLYHVQKMDAKGRIVAEKYAWDDKDLALAKQEVGRGYTVSRFKGLGEMNVDQLKDTTMNKAKRKLIQIHIEDAMLVEKRVGILMGKDTTIRRQWVEENVDFSNHDDFKKEDI